MHSFNVSGYISWASFLIFRMSVSDRPRREWRNQGIEMASLGTALQALPGGKLQSYMMQTVSGGLMEREWEWEKMAQLEKCLPSNHEDLSLDPQHPSEIRPGGTCLSP